MNKNSNVKKLLWGAIYVGIPMDKTARLSHVERLACLLQGLGLPPLHDTKRFIRQSPFFGDTLSGGTQALEDISPSRSNDELTDHWETVFFRRSFSKFPKIRIIWIFGIAILCICSCQPFAYAWWLHPVAARAKSLGCVCIPTGSSHWIGPHCMDQAIELRGSC